MIDATSQKDLVVLAADKEMAYALQGVLSHPDKLAIRPVCFDIRTHLQRDPGCRMSGHDFLRSFSRLYRYALVVFDKEGCGQEGEPRETIEIGVEHRLTNAGWADRSAAICIEPELEVWVWSDSPQVESVLGWQGRVPNLRSWLIDNGFIGAPHEKPGRPKECMRAALRSAGKPFSASLFAELAGKVGYARCLDPSFRKLVRVLQYWFGTAR